MSESEPLIHGPVHQVCEVNVETPTICVDGRDGSICVQWFGQTENEMPPDVEIPEGAQFLFPLLVRRDSLEFNMRMEGFMVVFLATVKDWPASQNVVQKMINGPGEGSEDTWLLWAMNPTVKYKDGGCPSLCAKIALLGDSNCGVIVPRTFIDLTVRDRALEKLAAL